MSGEIKLTTPLSDGDVEQLPLMSKAAVAEAALDRLIGVLAVE